MGLGYTFGPTYNLIRGNISANWYQNTGYKPLCKHLRQQRDWCECGDMDTSPHQDVDVPGPDLDLIWMALPDVVRGKLGDLTDMQKDYVLLVSVGEPSIEAYRRAYNRAPDSNPITDQSSAYRVSASVRVRAALVAISNGAGIASLLDSGTPPMTRQWVLERLSIEADDMKGNSGAVRVKALELIGRSQGMFEDVVKVKDERPTNMDEARVAFAELLARVAPGLLGDGGGGQEEPLATVVGTLPPETQGTDSETDRLPDDRLS